nr:hypothetical protein GCM10020092_095410 [Actinoplanes digitatis]
MPPPVYGSPFIRASNSLGPVAGEDEVRVAVHEAGYYRPAAGVEALVGVGCAEPRPGPDDPLAVENHGRVEQHPGVGIVGDQLTDVGDQKTHAATSAGAPATT